MKPRLSIVVPALNEADGIVAALVALAPLRAAGHEVIVVDGGSTRRHVALARRCRPDPDRAPRGRATQMNAGAAVATGDVLLFLHADTRLPAGRRGAIADADRAPAARWGRFDVRIDGRSRSARWSPR